MVLSVFRFRHILRKILTGNTLCHITGMRKWNLYMLPKEVLYFVPRTVPGCSRKDIFILLIPAHCTDCLETVRFPTIMRWVFRLDMLNFLQTDSCQTSYLVPLCTGKYLFPDSEALAPELTAQIAALIKKAADEYRNCDTSLTAALSIKITLLQILELLFASQSFIPGTQAGETSGDVNPLKAVFSYIESHYGEKISLEDLAGTIHMNRNYFCRFFKEKAGKTPFSYLNEYRVNQAASQLLSTRLPITEIALNAGFENMSYFIRQFRRCKGCTPSAYRNTEDPKSLPIPF